jgi:nicotinate-nucleotide--dimethylbenzimidazole phosphoribosyltransferase
MSAGNSPLLATADALGPFAEAARRAVYDAIALRRDVRHFRGDPVDDDVLARILGAAHAAPSVGFSQPWGFVVVRDRARRTAIRESFLRCREAEAARFPPSRREAYLGYRLEGILDAALNVCVAVDLRSRGEAILGTTVQPEAVRASACCAVQNLWLAARAEGIGVGWVSIVEPAVLREQLALPAGVEPIAYLCIGHARAFRAKPMLEETGWLPRRPLADVVHPDSRWRDPAPVERDPGAREEREGVTSARTQSSPPREDDVAAFNEEARAASLAHQATLTKPVGSLGRLEELAAWYAGGRGAFPSAAPRAMALAIFASDHGVVVEGVSAYGSQLTAAMVANVMAGGAAVNALARRYGVALTLVDVGVAGDLSAAPVSPVVPLVRARVRAGTRNLRVEDAMERSEAEEALATGMRVARDLGAIDLAAMGEVGIGNTTAAAALVCALTSAAPHDVVGRGTGLDDLAVARKTRVVEEALARFARRSPGAQGDAIDVVAALGGLELAAMAGYAMGCARRRIPVVLDGFLAAAAALVARAIEPAVLPFLLASHASAERGHRIALDALGLVPLLDLGMRLGEGTGALLAMDLVRTAVTTQLEMATFATAGLVGRHGTPAPR